MQLRREIESGFKVPVYANMKDHYVLMERDTAVAENQLLHRLFFTSSPWNTVFCNSLIISNNIPRTCLRSVSETFAEKVVQNAVAGMVQRWEQQSLALRRKAVSACNCKHYKKKIARDFIVKSLAIRKFWWSDISFLNLSIIVLSVWRTYFCRMVKTVLQKVSASGIVRSANRGCSFYREITLDTFAD